MDTERYSFREYPIVTTIFGLVTIGFGYFLYKRGGGTLITGVMFIVGTLLIVFLATILDVKADARTRILSISRRGLINRYYREIPFDEIATIQVGESYDRSDETNSRTYRIEVRLKDGSLIPLQKSYSNGRTAKGKKATALREFIGVGGVDASRGGFLKNSVALSCKL